MAMTATIAAPTNRHANAAPLMTEIPPEAPDWLSTQQSILHDAPDGDTACRWLLAAALARTAALEIQVVDLQAQMVALLAPAPPRRPTFWRPQIIDLLTARGAPMAAAAITQALDAPRSLADTCRDMAQAGLLIRDNGHYALPPEPAAPAPAHEPGPTTTTAAPAPGSRPGQALEPHPGAPARRGRIKTRA